MRFPVELTRAIAGNGPPRVRRDPGELVTLVPAS